MRRVFVLVGLAISVRLHAECGGKEYVVSKDGIGPFTMQTCVFMTGKEARFVGSARNDSGRKVRQASWCVIAPGRTSACAFNLWTTKEWGPGESIEWDVIGPGGHGLPQHLVSVVSVALSDAGCLIVKHKGTVGRRLIWTALTGIPIAPGTKYDLVDSLNYVGAKLAYKGNELQQIQATGVRIIVLPGVPSTADVQAARESCRSN